MNSVMRAFFGLAAALPLSGCVATQYQKASPNTPPPVTLNIGGTPATSLDATIETVITLNGPGSWKHRAYWDEYVFMLANRSRFPIEIRSARLVDASGMHRMPGDNWEELERESADWTKRNITLANVGLGAGRATILATGAVSTMLIVGGTALGSSEAAGLGAAGLLGSAGGITLMANASRDSEREIKAEFDRRRLELPHTILPGGQLHGSGFFRITPSPRELVIEYIQGGRAHQVVFDLSALTITR